MAVKKIRQVVLSGSRPTTAEMIETYGLTRKDIEFVNSLVQQQQISKLKRQRELVAKAKRLRSKHK